MSGRAIHKFQNTVVESGSGPGTGITGPNEWNDDHQLYLDVNPQTNTTYTFLASDDGVLVTLNNSGSVAVTLPQPTGTAATTGNPLGFYKGWFCFAQNIGSGNVTITPTSATINVASLLVLYPGQWAIIVCDGTNYKATVADGGAVRMFDSRAAAVTARISVNVNFIETGGYTTLGDGGGAHYTRTTGSTTGGFQSGDGAWWQLAEDVPNVIMFGAPRNHAGSGPSSAAAFQSAFNYAAVEGGTLRIPAGNYFINAGDAAPTMPVGQAIRLVGDGQFASQILCTADVSAIVVNSNYSSIENLTVFGFNSTSATQPAIVIGSGTNKCRVKSVHCWYGFSNLQSNCAGLIVEDSFFAYGYASLIHILGAAYVSKCWMDNTWPGTIPNYGTTINNWAATTAYTLNTVVQVGSYYVQCTQAGTSGSTTPGVTAYNTDIIDNTAKWRLVCPVGLIAGWVEATEVFFDQSDFSGAASKGISYNNSSGGAAPSGLMVSDCVISQTIDLLIEASAGVDLKVRGCRLGTTVKPASYGVILDSSWVGPATIAGNYFLGENTYAAYVAAGAKTTIQDNTIEQMGSAGIFVANSMSDFEIGGNTIRNCPIGVQIGSGCNHYSVSADNVADTCTTPFSSSSSTANDCEEAIGPWQTYTPTITAFSGTFGAVGAVSGRFQRRRKTTRFSVQFTITTNGTASAAINVSLPVTAANTYNQIMCGREMAVTFTQLNGNIQSNTTNMVVSTYNAGMPGGGANGTQVCIGGEYENA